MNTPERHDHPGQPSPMIEPAAELPPAQSADELFAHGLLTYLHRDHPAVRNDRIARVLAAIDADQAERGPVLRTLTAWRTWGALAAAVGIIAALAVFGVPGESSGLATVQKAIAAMQTLPGDRRFEIRTQGWDESELSAEPRGTVDTRAPGLTLLRIPTTDDRTVIVGADERGRWAIRPDGRIERDRVEHAWPRFATIGDESVFADSVDRLLEQAARFYTLSRKPDEALDAPGGPVCQHVRGIKIRDDRPGPSVIDVWINPATRIAERLQFTWDPPPLAFGPQPTPGDRPPPRRRPEGGPPGVPRADGPFAPPSSEREHIGPQPGDHPDQRRQPRPTHPPRPRGDGPRAEARPDGPGPGPRPRHGMGGFPIGPDGPGSGRPIGPPHRVLRLDRVDPPKFADGWFNPETHREN
ncbi:MAG: hypothetical protein ACK4WH_06240 [Phycisphaerales bacterium]